MKIFERLDLSRFVPELNTAVSNNKVVMGLLTVMNIVAYLRALFTKSWKTFLLLNAVVILLVTAYLFYRVSMWLHQKVKADPREDKRLVYSEITTDIVRRIAEFCNPSLLGNIDILVEVIIQAIKIYIASTLTGWAMTILSPLLFVIAVLDAQWIIQRMGYGSTKEMLEFLRNKVKSFVKRIIEKLPRLQGKVLQPQQTVS